MPTLEQEPWTDIRGATVSFTDTVSDVLTPVGAPPIIDFDAPLTDQARNKGEIRDAEFPVGAWPETASYGAVLLADLSTDQRRILDVYEAQGRAHLPDAKKLEATLDTVLVGILNSAPRRADHHKSGQNGDDFYLAQLDEAKTGGRKIQLFSQLPFLEGVATRGLVSHLWRIPDDNPIWPKGEQFRSSIVTNLRNFPELLVPTPLNVLEGLGRDSTRLVYADKYGNCRLEVPAGIELPEFEPGRTFVLRLSGEEAKVTVARNLTDIPVGHTGIYGNPADIDRGSCEPRYLELARRTDTPNNARSSAYAHLSTLATRHTTMHANWADIAIEIAA